jgi:extracellular factor (EF) 3-hydroxypalmitic acid methyl ester biosynthesis protein
MTTALSAPAYYRPVSEDVSTSDTQILTESDLDLMRLLDRTHELLLHSDGDRDQVNVALDNLFGGLARRKFNVTPDEWQADIKACRSHGLLSTIHEDPFTYRAFAKPRGYAGDAPMLDLIYGPEERWPEPDTTRLGLDIYRYTTAAPAAEGVRARRAFVADLIDYATSEKPDQHILAVAAGHLREALLSSAIRRRRFGRFVALDVDEISLAEVQREYGPYGVETVPAPFISLIKNKLQIGKFDIVYSTGLFDYLGDNVGRRLVRTLFEMLNPGGQLIVANFMPGIRDIAYMEAFMDWSLIYRTRQDMVRLTSEIDESEIRELSVFAEDSRNIIFFRLRKR